MIKIQTKLEYREKIALSHRRCDIAIKSHGLRISGVEYHWVTMVQILFPKTKAILIGVTQTPEERKIWAWYNRTHYTAIETHRRWEIQAEHDRGSSDLQRRAIFPAKI